MPLIQNVNRAQAPPAAAEAPPDPIHASATAWDLAASPAALQDAATDLRTRAFRLTGAQLGVDEAAGLLAANQDWTGDSADAYQGHRASLTGDLGTLASLVCGVADALDGIAAVLVCGQAALDQVWATISGIPHPRSGHDLRFQPSTVDEAALVYDAMTAASEIRAEVDEELVLKESALITAQQDLSAITQTWTPQTLTVMNLNVGQGKGNQDAAVDLVDWVFGGSDNASEGTDAAEMDEIADIIVGHDADVVTLQEVFGKDMDEPLIGETDDLEELLEERTGDNWEIHFAEADPKWQFDDALFDPETPYLAPFGNAVAVHEGGLITDSERVEGPDGFTLDDEGNRVDVAGYPIPDVLPDDVEDGEARAAAVVEVELRDR